MKNHVLSLVCVFGAAILGTHSATTPAAALAGPGGVLVAVTQLTKALDRADDEAAAKSLTRVHSLTFDTDGRCSQDGPATLSFVDVDPDGNVITADSAEAIGAFGKSLARDGLGRPATTIRSVRADCPSGNCSWAAVEFDRAWGEGEDRVVQELRATALVKHVGTRFRVFHWHVSPR